MKQDGKEFSPINEANPESLLQQAADGELVLFATARRHTAQLHAFPWVVTPKQSNRSRAAGLVPIGSELAKDLLCFPDSQLKMYLATDPSDCPNAHPYTDHYWVLNEPQPITREQIYSKVVMPADTPATKVEIVPSTNPSSDYDTQIDTTNLVYWRAILYSNIKKIDEHKKASARGIIKHLRGLKDKRILNKGGHDELFWIDDNDNEQCVAKKTINNVASLARKVP